MQTPRGEARGERRAAPSMYFFVFSFCKSLSLQTGFLKFQNPIRKLVAQTPRGEARVAQYHFKEIFGNLQLFGIDKIGCIHLYIYRIVLLRIRSSKIL